MRKLLTTFCFLLVGLLLFAQTNVTRIEGVVGLGGNVRYVHLPYESHGYAAKESQLYVMYEIVNFMEKYVKNREP